jgi:hypothetical protein
MPNQRGKRDIVALARNKLTDTDIFELLSPPKNWRKFQRKDIDPEFNVYRSVINRDYKEVSDKNYKAKCTKLHADLKMLLGKINKRHNLENKRDEIDSKLKTIDREIKELHRLLSEKY